MLRPDEPDPMDEFYDKLLKLMSPFGYDTRQKKPARLKDALFRYNRRGKEILRQIEGAGMETSRATGPGRERRIPGRAAFPEDRGRADAGAAERSCGYL